MTFSERSCKFLAKRLGRLLSGQGARWVQNPVFVIGSARSGTTLLANLLGRHKDIAHFSEANEVWDPKGFPWARSDLKRPPSWLDPYTFNRMWWEDVTTGYYKVLQATFGIYQRLRRKKLFLNKSPMNTFRIACILKFFPGARFIHIFRDGRAVAFSHMEKEYVKMQEEKESYRKRSCFYSKDELLEIMARFWVEHINEVEKQKKELSLKENRIMYELNYEDFCLDPYEEMRKIFDFLGLDEKRSNIRLFPAIESRNDKYKRSLSAAQVGKVTLIMKDALIRKGYSASGE